MVAEWKSLGNSIHQVNVMCIHGLYLPQSEGDVAASTVPSLTRAGKAANVYMTAKLEACNTLTEYSKKVSIVKERSAASYVRSRTITVEKMTVSGCGGQQ